MADLTPEEEAAFWSTGRLPDNPGIQVLSSEPDPEPAPALKVEVAPEPAPPPKVEALDNSVLERLLQEERQERRNLEAKLAESSKKPVVEEPLPDPMEDPLGNIVAQLTKSNNRVESLERSMRERDEREDLQRQYGQFVDNVRALKAEFVKTAPDFDDAYNYIRDIRTQDLLDTGTPRANIAQQLIAEEARLAQTAMQNGKNPAEQMYAMAKRYGYAASGAKLPPAAQTKAEEKVDRLKNGQFASKPAARSAPPVTELTAEGLKDASNSDLNNVVMDDKMWQQIVGGKSSGDIFL